MRRVLIVAAEQFELKHLPRRQGWILVANGPGPALAAEAAGRHGNDVDAVVSVGVCGALIDHLRVGDIVVATAINGYEIVPPEVNGIYTAGPFVSMDSVAGTIEEKRRLRDTGAIAVDMESAGLLDWARKSGKTFYCVRAVSDTAAEGFAIDFNAARGDDGRFSVGRIVGQAVRQPHVRVPELLRLRRNSARAARALGEFIGKCSF